MLSRHKRCRGEGASARPHTDTALTLGPEAPRAREARSFPWQLTRRGSSQIRLPGPLPTGVCKVLHVRAESVG